MRNLYTVLGKTAHKTHKTERSPGRSFGKVGNSLALMIFLILSLISGQLKAQVSTYSFAQSAGTYTAITGTTIHAAGWDDAATSIPIGFNFVFNGVTYTNVTVNSNGYIVFGTAGLTNIYTPISTLTGAGAVAAFGRDLNAQGTAPTGLVSYSSTGGVLTIQWSDCKRYTTATTAERFSFQIKLYQTTNVVQVVYGTFANAVLASTVYPQVGLRGAATTDFNNRTIATGGNWAASTAGGANTATAFYGSTSTATKPASGQTYTWTPPAAPTITSISPLSGCPGTVLTITGTNLSGATAANIKVGGTAVTSITSNTGTVLTALVGAGTTGTVTVTTSSTATSTQTFTVLSAPLAPTASAAASITSTSALASWAPSAGATQYFLDVATDAAFTSIVPGYNNLNVGNVTSYSITALTANTTYYYRVRASNGSCSGVSSATISFFTGYCLVSGTNGTYYISNFTTTGAVTNINNTSGYSAGGYGNFTAISMSSYAGQVVNFTSTFLGGGTMGFRIYIDWNNDLDFLDANENPTYGSGAYVSSASGSFTVPAGTPNGNYRMRIVADYLSTTPISCGASTYLEAEDYTITIAAPPSCVGPTALTSSAITSTTATISWTAPASAPASGYQYYVSTVNTAPTAGTTPSGTTAAGVTTASLNGLTANTTYYFWVSSNCGGSGTSTWAGSSSFFTGYCQATGTAAYYITNVVTASGVTNISNPTAANGGYGNFTAQSASNSIGTATSITISHSATGGGAGVGIWIDWNNDLDFADANEQIANSAAYNYSPYSATINIPAGTPLGNYRMRVIIDYNATSPISCPSGISGETEDYTFTVTTPPSCVAPTALTSSAITPTSATISWTAPASAPGSGYNYYVSTTNTAPTGATVSTGSTATGVTSASITGLTANTTYYYWVQSNCGGGNGTSAWAGSSSFFTGYCTPVATSTTTYFSNFVTTGAVSNISNNSAAISVGGYGNFTAQSASQYPGSTVGFQATIVGGTAGISVFIDWNNDLDFADAGETMYSSNAYQATGTTTSSFVIPAAAALGNYRMRIVTDYNAINPTPCSFAFGTGEAEDYTISVIALPLCSGTPAPGSTIASQTAFCSGTGTVNLSISTAFTLSGISYQWQSSTDGVSFSNVSGATSATYTTPTLSSTTYYQCVVTCSAGGSANSTPVAIIFGAPSSPTATNSVSCGPGIPTGTVASTSGLTNPNLTWYTASTGGNVVLTSYTGALTSYYSNDFSSNTGIGAMTGNASLTGGVVQLTPNLGSQLGALTIPASGVSADKYNVSFNLITSNVAQSGADGLSYSFGDDVSGTSTTIAAETGSGTKLKVSFDDYGTSGGGISGIRVIYGTTISDPGTTVGANGVLAYNATTAWTNGNVPVIIDINNLGQLTLTVNGTAIFSNLQLPSAYLNANKTTWKHGFKARTGGVSMIHSIDNVNIQQSSYVAATAYPNNVLATTTYYVTEANSVGCESAATPITFTVNAAPAMTISAATATVCAGSASSLVTLTSPVANYDTYTWTPSATVSGSSAAGWNFTPSANTTYTLTGTNATTQCSNIANITVTVNTLPTALTVTPSAATICVGNIQNLVATGGTMNATMFSEDFNGGVSSWTITNAGTSPVVSNWTAQTAPYTDATGSATFSNFSTSNGGKFAYSNPDAGGSGTTTNTVLMSPSFSTMNATNATLTFEHVYYKWTSGDATVALEISSDNGATWSVLKDYKTLGSQGTTTSNAQATTNESIVLGAAYLNKPNVKIRFNYVSTWGYFWIIDNIKVMGNQTVNVTWAGADAFSNATATTAYVAGSNTTSIYAKPTATTTYTATATSAAGCTSSATATLTLPTAGTALSQNNENATCTVNQNGWVHFYHSSGRLIASVNSQGQNLGAVTATSYVEGAPVSVDACTNSNPIYTTSVMGRHWVITPTNQPTSAVLVRLPYANTEFNDLTSAASTNANSNDDLLTPTDLGLSKYSNGTNANVNNIATDNCGVGATTFHTQLGNGASTAYSSVNASYADFSIPGFSEFWLHGSAQASPLPVELVSFQANCAGEGKVNVTWTTASEHNSANFTVEKSRDGMNWTVMASLAGAGNSTQMINYSTVDNNAAAGVNYYRLTQTDFDGASETFNIASANCGDNSPLTTVKVYPNPSAGDFYIDFTSEGIVGESIITITDSRGMTVYAQAVTVEKGSNVFHIENMEAAPGMYYIQVSNGTTTSNIVKHSLR